VGVSFFPMNHNVSFVRRREFEKVDLHSLRARIVQIWENDGIP